MKHYVNLNTKINVVLTHVSLNEVFDLLDLLRVRLLGQLARQLLALVRPDRVYKLIAVSEELSRKEGKK